MQDKSPSGVVEDFRSFLDGRKFGTILADPPWQFQNRTGKVAPEHKRLSRYGTMTLADIQGLPVSQAADAVHLYLWVPNALLPEGLAVMQSWGFHYKSNIVWHKIRKDGGSDGRGVGFYFRNVTEVILFGTREKMPGRCSRGAGKSITWKAGSANTHASRMNRGVQLQRTDEVTRGRCPLCKDYHPADQGIVFFRREFVCSRCGENWSDIWCADCNDRCPRCNAEIGPEPDLTEEFVFEEPAPDEGPSGTAFR